MRHRVLLFAKAPRPGGVKTRLAPALGEDGAAGLYEALLADTVDRLRDLEVPLEIHAAPGSAGPEWFRERYPSTRVRRQRGDDLGERLARAFDESFRQGDDAVMAVGSDHPTIPLEYLREGFRALADRDAVLGPGRDGGYYAVAIRRSAWPDAWALFRDIPWSTDRVASATRDAASAAGIDLGELPEWYDVDRPEDLALLRRDASPESRSYRTLERLSGEGTTERGKDGGGTTW